MVKSRPDLSLTGISVVRPEGFEPPAYCSGALCPCEYDHESDFERCYCSCHGDPSEALRRSDLELAA